MNCSIVIPLTVFYCTTTQSVLEATTGLFLYSNKAPNHCRQTIIVVIWCFILRYLFPFSFIFMEQNRLLLPSCALPRVHGIMNNK